MVAAMPLQNDARPSEKTVTLRDLRRVAFGLSAAIMIVMIAGAINDDSGSSTATVLEETSAKSFAAPVSVAAPTNTGTEDVAYSSTMTWNDVDGTDVVLACTSGCSSWITFTDGGNSANTATIAGTPLDAHVGTNTVTIQGTSGGETTQVSYTITISEVNDEPTLTATGATGTFTEDGSNVVLYSSAAAADSDSQATQTFTSLILTVTNVADTTEYLVVNAVDCDLNNGNSENAGNVGGSAVTCAVSVTSGTATVTLTHAGMTAAQIQTLIDAIAYKNTDQSPTAGNRVATITTMTDSGGTAGAGDDSVTVAIAATVTVAAAGDDPVIANSDNTGAVTEAVADTTDTATDTLVVTDADGETVTWSCTNCADGSTTQTLTGTYGSWVLTEATGAWAYTLNNADTDTDQLDAGDSVTDTLTAVATDSSGATDSITVTVTITGANDAPSTSTPSTQSGAEDNTFTGYAISDFPFTDVDDADSALTSITITVVESSGDLEKSTDGLSWTDVSANDVILAAHIQHLRLAPVANSNADVTFTYTVQDGATSSGTAVMTTSFAAANDVPTWSGTAADVTTNEDVAKTITGSVIADVDDTTLDSMTISSTQSGTFTLASTNGLTFANGDGTDDNSMVFGGTVANINTAIATITWTSAANVNTDAVLSLTANDGDGDSATDTVAITVNAVQDLPTTSGGAATIAEDGTHTFTTTPGDWGYADVDTDSMTQVDITTLPATGTLRYSNADVIAGADIAIGNLGGLTYVPVANANGAVTFTFKVHDGTAWSTNAGTFTMTYTAVNDAPTAAADTRAVVEDTQTALTSSDIEDAYSDTESNSMTRILITVVESSGDLECNNADGSSNGWADCVANQYVASSTDLRFTTDTNSVADVTFSFKVYDGTAYSANAYVFTITVTAVNDAPANAGDTATASEDVAYAGWTAAGDWGYSDVDGDTMISITLKSLPSQGTLTSTNNACGGDNTCAIDDVVLLTKLAAGDLKYTGASNYNGADSFTYTVEDSALSSSTGTMTMTVSPVNDVPVAGDTSDQTVYEDLAFSFQTAQSTDVDGDTMTIACVETGSDMPAFLAETADSGGQATLGGTATAAALTLATSDADNTYGMTCTTTDSAGGTATDTFVITVTAVNDAPVLSSDGSGVANEGTVVEDAAFSVTLTATDEESADVTFAKNGAGSCPTWITISDGGANDQTATLAAANTATTDAVVGDNTCDITLSDGTNTILETYTLTITQKNDEPTVSATTATPTFTEDGNAVSIYSSSAVADSDAQETQTFTSLVLTVTNVADTTEYLQVNGGDCDLTNGNSETTTISSTNDLTCAVAVAGNPATATVTITHAGLTAAQMQTLIDGLKYTNSDQSPTAGNRVITITTMTDSGGTSNSGDNSVTVSIASTVTAAAADDDPVIANSDNTGAVTEASAGTTDTATDTLVASDADGETITWSCTSCTDGDGTQTLTDVYGSWVLTEATGAWTYTLNNADAETDALDGGDSVQETIVMVAADASGGNTDSITVTITITGANDLPTSSATTTAGAEDTTLTFQTSDFTFTDVDGDDSAASAFQITVLESSGDLECNNANGGTNGWADCSANDIVTSAAHIRISPVAGETPADVTFSYKVSDGTAYSSAAYVKTIDFAAVNDAPVNTMGTPSAVNEDTANAITGTSIADSDSTSMSSVQISADRGTFTLATSSATYDVGTQGTAASTVTISGTVANINTAIATITWTSASNDDADATITMVSNDGSASDTDTMSITVNSVNDAPTSTSFTVTTNEDVAHTFAASEFGYADVDSGDALVSATLQAASAGQLWVDADASGSMDNGEAVVANGDTVTLANLAKLKWLPAANANGATYGTFTYTLNDGEANSASSYTATLAVTAVDDVPVCNAGSDQSVAEGATVTLDATGSTDVEGATITYVWSIASGTTQTLSSTTNAAPTFTAAEGTAGYTTTVQLVCTASGAAGTADTAVITVSADNDAPTANAGSDQAVAEGASVTLTAAASSDPEGQTLSYTWSQTGGTSQTLSATNVAAPTFTAAQGLAQYTSTFQVSVTDGTTASTDTVIITVTADNDGPTANAGSDQTPTEGATVTLTAAASSDPEGESLTYTWSQTGGTTMSLSSTSAVSPTFTAPEALADYTMVFQVSVTDGTNSASTDSVSITVSANNDAPTANAGSDQSVAEGASVTLTAAASSDPESQTLSYTWSQTGGTSQTLSATNVAAPTFTAVEGLAQYTSTFQVSVTDGTTASTDTVIVTVSADNDGPTANAGSDQTPTEGATVTLTAAASSDPEGESLSYTWSQTSGTTMSLSSTSAVSPTFTAPQATADYTMVFQVSVTDGTNSASTDSVSITVSADNDAPSITSTAVTSATEDAAYSYTVTTSDPESQSVTVTCTTCPSWLSYSSSTGKLTGTPDNDDVGNNAVVISATDGATAVTQSFTVAVANVNSIGSVSLSGTTAEDSVLTATVSDPDGMSGVTVTYQWQRTTTPATASSWSSISGATSSTYTLTQSDVSNYMRVTVSYTDAQGGSESHTGMMGTTISNVNDANTGTPTMSGSFMENQVITADATPLNGNDEDGMTGSSYTYQWQSCTSTSASSCSDISGATSTTYTITQSETGDFLRVRVSYTDDYSTDETVNSALSSQVGNVNDAPSAGADQTGAITEDASTSTATGTVQASDQDPNTVLTYTASSTSGTYGSFAVTSSGAWTYTLDNSDSDTSGLDTGDSETEQYTITVSDGSLSDTMTVTVTITGANDAPAITSTAVTSANEDVAYSYTTTATDDDSGDTVTLTCTTVPSWLTCSSGALSGTPTNAHVGNHPVVITASDGTVSVTDSFTIAVANANDAPAITSTAVTTATEDAAYTYTVTASDADGDSLTMTGTTVPSWLSFNAATGVLSGTPANANVGTSGNAVVITVTDGNNGAVTDSFTITVANTNDAPTVANAISDASTDEDAAYSLSISNVFTDVDSGDSCTYSISGAPSTITLSSTTISGTPVNADVGTHTIVVTCTDGSSVSVSDSYILTVANTNDAPTLASAIADASTAEDASYSLDVSSVFTDVDSGDTLTYTMSGAPSSLSISSGTISGAPVNADVGTHTIVVTATDGSNAAVSDTYILTVTNTNDAPTITSTADTTAEEDDAYSYTTVASDVDAGDTVTLTCTTVPTWLSCTAGALTGTPSNSDVGSHSVVITATDASGATALDSFTIVVANANDAPSVTSTAVTTATEDSLYTYTLTASDADAGDTLTMSGTTVPSWLTFTASTGVLTGTPTNDDVGANSVVLTVTDAAGASVTDSFTVTVTNTNDAPTISSSALTTATEDSAYSYTTTASDVDAGDTVTLTCTTVPTWMTCTAGALSGTPTNDEVGAHSVVITATDVAGATATDTFTVTVANTNDAPTITSTAGTAVDEDSAYSYSITTSDVDSGDTLAITFACATCDDGTGTSFLSITDNGDGTATLAGTPVNEDVGSHSVTVTVTDAAGATATETFTIVVADTNDAPTITSTHLTTVDEDSLYSYTITATDPDGNEQAVYSYDATTNPAWLSFTDNGDGTATLTGTPDNSNVGTHTVSFSVSDGTATDSASFDIAVANTQDASTGSISLTGTAYEGLTLTADTSGVSDDDGVGTFTYQWSDADGDISGATSSTYVIPACTPTVDCASIGKVYSVTAVHTDAYGVVESLALSAGPTSAVVINPTGDLDSDGISNDVDTDIDGDGWNNAADAFDYDGTEWADTDSDGIGNNADTDDDADGVADADDDFPLDDSEQWDADGDGWGHNADVDDDGDGILDADDDDDDGDGDPDATDQFPNNYNEWDDTDSDGIGNNADTDDDGDGTDDTSDAFSLDACADVDTDGDGQPDTIVAGCTTTLTEDTDDDGDGYSDADETTNCGESNDPLDATSTPTDTDGDLSCNALDADDDGDGVDDTSDAFPLDSTETADYDGDGTGDNADTDDDADGVLDTADAFPLDIDAWTDTDGDGLADDFPNYPIVTITSLCDIVNTAGSATCSFTVPAGITATATMTATDYYAGEGTMTVGGSSYTQASSYGSGQTVSATLTEGSYTLTITDTWSDGGQSATVSYVESVPSPSVSAAGTVLDMDDDGDTVSDVDEATAGTDPLDADTDDDTYDDGVDVFPLDASEWLDTDSDGMGDNEDAFPTDECATVDTDGDGQPDTVVSGCTTTLTTDVDDDNDGVGDAYDAFPLDASETTDTDNDGTGDNADTDDDGDGYADVDDWAPLDSGEWWDTDGDNIGNNADADDDADGTPDGDDTYPMDNDNDGWDDVYEDTCGTDKTSATSTPSDNDGDTVKLAHTGVQSTTTVPVNLCDAIDPDDDNDGHLDGESVSIGGQYVSFTSVSSSITLPAGETLDVVLNTYSYGSEASLTMVMPDGTSVDMGSFSSYTTSTWSYTDAGTYSFTLGDSWGDGGQLLTTSWSDDMFPFDVEAWDDTDGDGLTDYIDPNSTAYSYTTVQLCSGYGQTNPGTPWYTMSSYPSPAVGDYIAVDSGGNDEVSCTFDLPAGETLVVTLQTGSYGSEARVTVAEPSGTSTTYGAYPNYFASGSSNTIGTYTTAGTYTVTYGDSYGDGCNPSTFYGACFVQASYSYISGTVAPTVTTYGTSLDYDDDNDGYSDLDETTNCDDGGAYASSSLPLDATSTPADMDGDLTCDALDSDRDGDSYANSADVFPDDVNEWGDNDADGTGDNADTDDDDDGTLDVSDAFPMDECADTDTDGDGSPDTIVSGCTTSLTEDANDDNDQDDDVDDPFPLDDAEWDDTDSDGIGNNADTDDDGDGTLDVNDVWPLDLCAADDFDGDGLPDTIVAGCTTTLTEDTDDDNDGVDDLTDDCPYDANEQVDTDGDGYCDNQDTDDDNDGTYDLNDAYPLDPTEQADDDGDGIGDNADTDDDNDGVLDPQDAFPNDPTESSDFDGDGIGDNADLDDDGDNVLDDVDPFPLDGTAWLDNDGDGIPDYTGPPPFSGDFETGGLGSMVTSSLATHVWVADSTNPISGFYSAMTTNQNQGSTVSGMMVQLTNMVNDTDTDGDGIADAASYSFAYSVSTEGNWDYLSFCVDNDANCQRTSGYTMRWSGTATGTYSGTVSAGAHTFTWNYWKDSIVDGGSDTVWIDDITMSVPQGITNADLDDDNDGVADDMDLDPLDPCVGLDTDGDGMADSLGSTMLNGSTCDASMYTIDDDDDGDGWTDSEEAICGSDSLDSADTPADYDMDMVCDITDLDDDNDGFNDDVDAFPMNSSEAIDTDGDGIGNNADSDDDSDGVTDGLDAFPLDSSESNDNDGDGTGDNADTDDDNDGCLDADDAFPMNAAECVDTDGDMLGDNVDPDDDGDGVADVSDPFPLDPSESSDNDGDGVGDNTDTDDDGDGVDDVDDAFPLDPLESEDLDGDGQGDNSDADDDGDGVNDGIDAFPTDNSEWVDTDGDGTGDNTDADDDGDGVNDVDDAFPMNPSESNDLDGDGLGDNADSDDDGDGDSDETDQFPTDATEWDDTDGDGVGDNEDTDDDGDEVSDDEEDSCGSDSMDANSVPSDFDGDGICDVLDLDDNDGPLANVDGGDEPGFGKSVPGFPALFAAIALIGAALIGSRRDD